MKSTIIESQAAQAAQAAQEFKAIDRLVPIDELEKIIGKSRKQIYALLYSGKLPKPSRLNRSLCWKLSEINRWLASL